MKMEMRELLLVFSMLWSMTTALRCYKCNPQKDDYGHVNLCEHFDYSDKYLVDCHDSTRCYKKEITFSLMEGSKLYERDCAKQTMNGDQEKDSSGRWVSVNKIYEIDEGCHDEGLGEKVTKTVHCYCRGDLCNSAVGIAGGVFVVIGPLLLVYLLQ